jgi:hypothetical protein
MAVIRRGSGSTAMANSFAAPETLLHLMQPSISDTTGAGPPGYCLLHQFWSLHPSLPSEPTSLRVTAAQSNLGAWHFSRVQTRCGRLLGFSVDFLYRPCRCASLSLLLYLSSLGQSVIQSFLAFSPFHSFSHSFDIPLHCFDSSVPLLLLHSLHFTSQQFTRLRLSKQTLFLIQLQRSR